MNNVLEYFGKSKSEILQSGIETERELRKNCIKDLYTVVEIYYLLSDIETERRRLQLHFKDFNAVVEIYKQT